jgi:predicted transcriptional regulator of viral defense system
LKPSSRNRDEIRSLLSRAPEIFTNEQARSILLMPANSVNQKLSRWAKAGYLRRIRKGTYLQVPNYIEKPQEWFGDEFKLAVATWPNSYFTGWTSANHWGLTEQVFRKLVVVTSDRVRTEKSSVTSSKFLVKRISKLDLKWGIVEEWRDGTKISFANPSRTVIDVMTHPELGGGIRLGTEFLKAFTENYNVHELVNYAVHHCSRSGLKRLGYLLELNGYSNSLEIERLRERISKGIIFLDPSKPAGGSRIMKWNILVNTRIETEDRS